MRTMFVWGVSAVVVSTLGAGMAQAVDAPDLKSGLRRGEYAGPFEVHDITGPNQGHSLCYRCTYGQGPVVCVFARRTSPLLARLVKALDSEVARDPALKSFVVVLTDDLAGAAGPLRALAEQERIKNIPLTLLKDPAGPSGYRIAREADISVLMWKDYSVEVSRAFAKGEMSASDVRAIVAELPRLRAAKR